MIYITLLRESRGAKTIMNFTLLYVRESVLLESVPSLGRRQRRSSGELPSLAQQCLFIHIPAGSGGVQGVPFVHVHGNILGSYYLTPKSDGTFNMPYKPEMTRMLIISYFSGGAHCTKYQGSTVFLLG